MDSLIVLDRLVVVVVVVLVVLTNAAYCLCVFFARYHGDWKSETQAAVSLLAFMHWFETGTLLGHAEAEQKLGCMFSFH